MIKNLVFFLCPFFSNNDWLDNVKTIKKYLEQFNGKIVVCVAVGEGLHEPQVVKTEFIKGATDQEVQWVLVENNPLLGEVQGFVPSMRLVESTKHNEMTFYCHAKGVSPGKTMDELDAVRTWRQLMYTYCLGDTLRIEAVLKKWSCCGCFKKYGRHHLSTDATWHFSGTFFWFHNDRIFNNPTWDSVIEDRFWVEGFLAQFIPAEEAFCLFGNDPWPCNLYKYSNETWLQFYDIPPVGEEYRPKTATESLSTAQKITLIKHWSEITNESARNLLLKREGVTLNELNEWIRDLNF